jgi:hypothetical protein
LRRASPSGRWRRPGGEHRRRLVRGRAGDRGPPMGAAGCPRSPASHGYRTACPVRDEASTPRLLLASISLDTLQQRFTALGIGPNGRTGVNDLQHVDWQAVSGALQQLHPGHMAPSARWTTAGSARRGPRRDRFWRRLRRSLAASIPDSCASAAGRCLPGRSAQPTATAAPVIASVALEVWCTRRAGASGTYVRMLPRCTRPAPNLLPTFQSALTLLR